MRAEELIELLDGVRSCAGGWSARCPAHDDHRNSLAVGEGEDGKILLTCFAGCTVDQIVKALGLTMPQLFPHPVRPRLTVEALAFDKRLPGAFLRSLGVRDAEHGVEIPYLDLDGNVACLRRRTALSAGAGSSWPSGTKPVPYGLDRLGDAQAEGQLVLVEGESDCWTLWHHGFAALGIPGCMLAGKLEAAHLEGLERVYVLVEPDAGGASFLDGVSRRLGALGYGGGTLAVTLAGAKDPNDLHRRDPDAFVEAFRHALEGATPFGTHEPSPRGRDARTAGKAPKTQSTLLVELAREGELFRAPDGETYVTLPVQGRPGTHCLRARQWLALAFYERHEQVAHGGAIGEALEVLRALALRGPVIPVHTRVGQHGDAWYLFLADKEHRAVEITPDGWRVVDRVPARFWKAPGALPLPEPERGGTLEQVQPLLNLREDDWLLVRGWLLAALRPVGPYPLLGIHGEPGSTKTTLAQLLCALVDPTAAYERAEPDRAHDLMIAARNGWMLSFGNLSYLPRWLAEGLCRLSTGGAMGKRELFSDGNEVLFEAMRPVIVNGIEELVGPGDHDLLQRTVMVQVPTVGGRWREISAILAEFEGMRPQVLGALLDVLVEARRNLPHTHPPALPRMADFARLVTAAEPALGVRPGRFLEVYGGNQTDKDAIALEVSPVAAALLAHARSGPSPSTAAELLATLSLRVSDKARNARGWPASARVMASQVRRLTPTLRAAGIEVTFERAPGGIRERLICFERCAEPDERAPTLPLPAATAISERAGDEPAVEEVIV